MPNLMKLGLVERVLKNPATYKALPLKDGLSLLLQKRKEEYDELQKKASLFLSNAQRNQISKNVKEAEDTQFAIIYDQTLLFQKYEKYNLLAEKTIDCSGDWQGIKWLISLCNCSNDLFTQAMKKGVRIRIITEERDQDNSVDKNILGMNKNPLFGIRFVAAPIPLKLVLYDGKEAYTSISTSEENDMPMMWSINPNFVGIMAKQFDQMWEKGAKFSPIRSKNSSFRNFSHN